jgi:hypothetical protein
MKYLQKSFSLPAGSPKLTQAEWDRAFGPPRKEKKDKPKKKKEK